MSMRECESCGVRFEPRFVWQKYCSRECYEVERKFRERLRFDQSLIWLWNRKTTAILLFGLFLTGCAKPRTSIEIPEPTAKNQILAWDGEKAVWISLVGGPSGAIDATSHFGEIEIVNEAVAKYIRSPVTYAKEPAEGQLVVYGPTGSSEQAVMASGMSADVIGIANGVLIPAKLPAPPPASAGRMILGWTHDTYLAPNKTVYVTWGSMGLAGATNRIFAMPMAGKLTRLMIATRGAQPATGALEFRISKAGIAAPGLQLIIASGAPAGVFQADGNVDIATGDLVQIEITNRAASNSAYINAITAVFEY